MKIDFPYPGYEGFPPVEIPDSNLMGVFAPRTLDHVDEREVIARGIASPHGARRLRDELKGKRRVLILIEDGTRGTPIPKVMPPVLEEFRAAGVPESAITLLTAQGTHRRMTDDELHKKLGNFYGRFPVHQHQWLEKSAIHEFGRLKDGTVVSANRLLLDADFVMGLGEIVPHRIKGFSGGAKIAFPGVAGPEMQHHTQWMAARRMSETVMGIAENPMRLEMEEAAKMVGLRFVLNQVSDAKKRIAGCFSGHPVAAHRAGCRLSREINSAVMPNRADIVIIDSHPADRDFWQSAKAVYSGTMAVRDGGSMIVVAPNPEGVADNHPNLLQIGYRPYHEIVRMVERAEVDDVVGAAVLADVCQVVDRTDCIMVSPGMSADECERIGFRHAATVNDALTMALEKQGLGASIAVLRQGGHILPLADGQSVTI